MDDRKRRVVLAFPHLKALIDFTMLVDANNCEIVRSRSIFICDLLDSDVVLAIHDFGAVEID